MITPQSKKSFFVVLKPKSRWLHLSKTSGKPPFKVVVTVDTTGLAAASGYKEMLEFWSGGAIIHLEPIYLTTRVYDQKQLVQQPYNFPLSAGKAKRNPVWSLIDAVLVVYHLVLTVIYLWVGLFLLLLVLAIIIGILSS